MPEQDKTVSEELFERACGELSIPFAKIVQGERRSPDYQIELGAQRVVVEVKEIENNPDEREAEAAFERGQVGSIGTSPGHRIRRKIKKAVPQLKELTDGEVPGILLLVNRSYVAAHTNPYFVLVGMYGFETHLLAVSEDPAQPPRHRTTVFGRDKTATESMNTSLSAVAILTEDEGGLKLDFFHNRFAAAPLEPQLLRNECVRHFKLPGDARTFSQWVEI